MGDSYSTNNSKAEINVFWNFFFTPQAPQGLIHCLQKSLNINICLWDEKQCVRFPQIVFFSDFIQRSYLKDGVLSTDMGKPLVFKSRKCLFRIMILPNSAIQIKMTLKLPENIWTTTEYEHYFGPRKKTIFELYIIF